MSTEKENVYEQTKADDEFEKAREVFDEKVMKNNADDESGEAEPGTAEAILEGAKEAVLKAEEFVADTIGSAYESAVNAVGAVAEGAKEAIHGLVDSEPARDTLAGQAAEKHSVHQPGEGIPNLPT